MLHHDWLIELGRYLERVRRLETDVDEIREDVGEIRTLMQRIALLAILWGSALVIMLSNDRAAEIILRLIALRSG